MIYLEYNVFDELTINKKVIDKAKILRSSKKMNNNYRIIGSTNICLRGLTKNYSWLKIYVNMIQVGVAIEGLKHNKTLRTNLS